MKNWILGLCLVLGVSCADRAPKDLTLWFDEPARMWEERLPVGNGHIGMMADGGVAEEDITLNDITLWSGSAENTDNPDAQKYLPQIRELLLEGRNDEAQELMYGHFTCAGKGSNHAASANDPYGCYQVLGSLRIAHEFAGEGAVADYRRRLLLDDAVAETSFLKDGVRYEREYFVSHAGDVAVVRLTADRDGELNFAASLARPERYSVRGDGQRLVMEGTMNDGYGGAGNGYRVVMAVACDGNQMIENERIVVRDARSATLVLSSATALFTKDYETYPSEEVAKALAVEYDDLKAKHIGHWQERFGRVSLELGAGDDARTTDLRLADFQTSQDPALAALYFQFGRYLMLSGTREDTLPLNLQGLWAKEINPAWNADYHLNINLQMNYWPMEVGALGELHRPLTELVKLLRKSGGQTAKSYYGSEGWVAHMMTNPWGFTAPGEEASWGATNTGGAWLCLNLWEHYLYSLDREYLAEIYPVMRGAAEFFRGSMIREPNNGWLVTGPSSSPENAFYMPDSQRAVNICMGPAMDTQLVRELFSNVVEAGRILEVDREFCSELEAMIQDLPPMQISPNGYLQEWLEDYAEVDPRHRHVSHLFGLYPAHQISPNRTPELAAAARETLNRRGDAGTGWSRAWKICFWARLKDGDRALKLLTNLLEPMAREGEIIGGSGTYPNLFCAHAPFQIDGNFGGTAGIAEMLLQSHNGMIEVLPALPAKWADGSFEGLCVRGGGVVSTRWRAGHLERLTLTAKTANRFTLKFQDRPRTMGKATENAGGLYTVDLDKGERIEFAF